MKETHAHDSFRQVESQRELGLPIHKREERRAHKSTWKSSTFCLTDWLTHSNALLPIL